MPISAWFAYFGIPLDLGDLYSLFLGIFLIGSVIAAVHHAEVIAYRVGEPFGSLLLASAITVIEVAVIVSLMLNGGRLEAVTLARDTVLASVMIILTGIIGICILVGAIRYKEQVFRLQGVSAALVTLTAILVFALILPKFTTGLNDSKNNPTQLIIVAIACLVLYITFVMVQTVRHRAFFLSPETTEKKSVLPLPPSVIETLISALLLVCSLGIVVLLAKALTSDIENVVLKAGASKSLVGVIIAAVVLLPEGLAAYRAARENRLQTSLNLALGSALASIGLTIPTVAVVCLITEMKITLGIDMKAMVLLVLAQFTIVLSLATGRTNVLQGIVLLTIFVVYLFAIISP